MYVARFSLGNSSLSETAPFINCSSKALFVSLWFIMITLPRRIKVIIDEFIFSNIVRIYYFPNDDCMHNIMRYFCFFSFYRHTVIQKQTIVYTFYWMIEELATYVHV